MLGETPMTGDTTAVDATQGKHAPEYRYTKYSSGKL